MKAKEFLEGKTLSAIETVNDLIINLVIENSVHGLNVDTSSIEFGNKLIRTENFSINEDILISGDISVNLNEVDMLG